MYVLCVLSCFSRSFHCCRVGAQGTPSLSFHAPELEAVLQGTAEPSSIGVSMPDVEAFFMCLALCHTVVPERDGPDAAIVYQAESPDEGALVQVRVTVSSGAHPSPK